MRLAFTNFDEAVKPARGRQQIAAAPITASVALASTENWYSMLASTHDGEVTPVGPPTLRLIETEKRSPLRVNRVDYVLSGAGPLYPQQPTY